MKLLYVEDEEDLRDLYVFMFEVEFECEVLTAVGGKEAIEILEKTPDIDIVLSDFRMPTGNGNLVYKYIVNKYSNKIPFCFITANDLEHCDDIGDFLNDRSNNRYFQKPPNEKDMCAEIWKLLDRPVEKNNQEEEVGYHRIRFSTLMLFDQVCADIYIQINQEKYLKIISGWCHLS